MTIAVGFLCSDGIVIAADRKITADGGYTYPESKLASISWANGRGVVVYSGLRDTFIAFEQALNELLSPATEVNGDDVENQLRNALSYSVPKKEHFEVMFGFWSDDSAAYRLLCGTVRQKGGMSIVPVSQCEVIGCDSPLTRFMRHNILSAWHTVNVWQAMFYAVRIVSNVCVFDAQFVGNGMDLRTISYRNDAGRVGIGIQAGTGEFASQVSMMDYWYEILFRQITANEDGTLDITQFIDAIRRFRTFTCGSPILKPMDS